MRTACIIAVLAPCACTAVDGDIDGTREARLVLELSIGERPRGADSEGEFSSVFDARQLRSGDVWVVDGVNSPTGRGLYRVLVYDRTGKFVRNVGRAGEGPGEFENPSGLAELPDGRIALRSGSLGQKILIFRPDGAYDTTLLVPNPSGTLPRPWGGLRADSSGTLWLENRQRKSPQDNWYLRMQVNRAALDSVVLPWTSPTEPDIKLIGSDCNPRWLGSIRYTPSFVLSNVAEGFVVRADSGSYALEVYRVADLGAADSVPSVSLQHIVHRTVSPVPVSEPERSDMRDAAISASQNRPDGCRGVPPAMPRFKPAIRMIELSENGDRILVYRHTPSVRSRTGSWTEPYLIEVLEIDGRYVGSIRLPDRQYLHSLLGDTLWARELMEDDTSVLRRYRIEWSKG